MLKRMRWVEKTLMDSTMMKGREREKEMVYFKFYFKHTKSERYRTMRARKCTSIPPITKIDLLPKQSRRQGRRNS